jgi:hypothetical protein
MNNPQYSYQLGADYEAKHAKAQLADLYATDPLKACRLALRRTKNISEKDRLEACNTLLGTYGTEAIRGEWQNGYWGDIVACYCNTGESYALTILQVRGESRFDNSKFLVSSMGDFVERNSERYSIQ